MLLTQRCSGRRAENSHTARHLAEFWMIEPEIAYADLTDAMNCAEDYVRYCCRYLLDTCRCARSLPSPAVDLHVSVQLPARHLPVRTQPSVTCSVLARKRAAGSVLQAFICLEHAAQRRLRRCPEQQGLPC